MQTPKSRNSSSVSAPQKKSPQSISSESTLKNSPQAAASSEAPKKVSPRVVRQLKTGSRYSDHATSSSNIVNKVSDHRSPKSRASPTKFPSRVSELEAQVSQLEKDLKTVRYQLRDTEASKKRAEKEAEEANRQVLALSLKFEESQKKLSDKLVFTEICQEREQLLKSDLKAVQKQHSGDKSELASALEEIERLKIQLEVVAESEATRRTNPETETVELSQLRKELSETLLLVEDMKNQLRDCKESEAQANEMVDETLMHLANAKKMVDMLRSDGLKATGDYDSMVCELEKSRARVDYLEELAYKLKAKLSNDIDYCNIPEKETKVYIEETEISEVKQLRSALEAAEIRYGEEQARSAEDIKNAFEMAEKIKSESGQREAELESELQRSKYKIEELKANLMDKETELQGICEENEGLMTKLEKSLSGQREQELEEELNKSKTDIENLKTLLSIKETELQNITEEHEKLKSQINGGDNVSDIDSIRVSESEALMKVGYMMEEIDKGKKKVTRIAEQLEAAQAINADMEAEMRRLKVQSLQWRKAAEAAAAMISAGGNSNWQITERTDNRHSPNSKKTNSTYGDEFDDDILKKKNANGLRRFWKKPHK